VSQRFDNSGFAAVAEPWQHARSCLGGSCLYLAGMLAGAAFALYPNVLPASTGEQFNLTIYNTVTGSYGMRVDSFGGRSEL
jgi:cytochrome bd-type quinol oxidase subunit 2